MISVAMASYNGAKYIEQQVDSILMNLSCEDELVISDDGSTDGTMDIILQYQKQDKRVRVETGPGKGIIANFESVMKSCKGDYIFLSDQDDVWKPDKAEKILRIFKETGCGMVLHDAEVYNEDLTEKIMESYFDYRGSKAGVLANITKNRYMGCCMAFKKELRAYCLPIPKDIQMHDQWIGLVNDIRNEGTVLLKEPLLYYRRHEGTGSDFSRNTVPIMIKNRMVLLRDLWRYRRRIRGK